MNVFVFVLRKLYDEIVRSDAIRGHFIFKRFIFPTATPFDTELKNTRTTGFRNPICTETIDLRVTNEIGLTLTL